MNSKRGKVGRKSWSGLTYLGRLSALALTTALAGNFAEAQQATYCTGIFSTSQAKTPGIISWYNPVNNDTITIDTVKDSGTNNGTIYDGSNSNAAAEDPATGRIYFFDRGNNSGNGGALLKYYDPSNKSENTVGDYTSNYYDNSYNTFRNIVGATIYNGVMYTFTDYYKFVAIDIKTGSVITSTRLSLPAGLTPNTSYNTYTNGDIAFDSTGQMWVLFNAGGSNGNIYIGKSDSNGKITSYNKISGISIANSLSQVNGVAFDAAYGVFYISTSDSGVYTIKPSATSGTTTTATSVKGAGTGGNSLSDLASCGIVPNLPSISKAFDQSTVTVDATGTATARLSITVNNTNLAPIMLYTAVVDTLPKSGNNQMIIASTPNLQSTCTATQTNPEGLTARNVTATAGATSFTLPADLIIPVGGCTYSFNVTMPAEGTYNNIIASGTKTSAGDDPNGGKASIVVKGLPTLTLVKKVSNTNGGTAKSTDWILKATNGTVTGTTTITGATGTTVVTNASVTVGAYTLSESGGPSSGYTNGTYSCVVTPAGGTAQPAVTSNTVTLAAGDAAVCTVTNSDQPVILQLQKKWVNGANGDTATLNATGSAKGTVTLASKATSANSTTVANNTDTTAFTAGNVNAGETITLAEVIPTTGNTNKGGYSASAFTCTGGGTLSGSTLTTSTADLGKTITCTITNTRTTNTLQLAKAWTNGKSGDIANIPTTTNDGISTNVAALGSTAPTAASGTAVTVYSGDTFTLGAESMNPTANLSNYTTTLGCIGGSNAASGTNGQTSNTLTISKADSGKAIVCTYSNSRKTATLAVAKQWAVNSKAGDATTVTTTNLTTNASSPLSTATAAGNTSTFGTAVTVYAGDAGVLGETFGTGSQANYNQRYTCTGGLSIDTSGNFTIASILAGQNLTCTLTNTRKSATLQLQKTWTNGKANDVASIGATNNAGSVGNTTGFTATAPNTATSNTATVYAGDVIALPGETMTTGNLNNYTATLGCGGVSSTLSGTDAKASNTLTIDNADVSKAITCIYNNSRIAQQVKLAKQWVNVPATDTVTQVSATTTGGTNNATFSTTAPTNVTGTAVTMYAGDSVTLPTETVTSGTASATYSTTVYCEGGSPLATQAAPVVPLQTIVITNSTTATTCTYTNTADKKAPSIALDKYVRNTSMTKDNYNTFTDDRVGASAGIDNKGRKIPTQTLPQNVLQYCISYENTGGLARNFVLTDNVPGNVNVDTGSLVWSATTKTQLGDTNVPAGAVALTAAADSDQGTLTATGGTNGTGQLSLKLGDLIGGAKGTVCFNATVK